MTISEMLKATQFIVDAAGNKKGVLLDYSAWEELLTLLEDLEDSEEMRDASQEDDEIISWAKVKAEYQNNHPDLDV